MDEKELQRLYNAINPKFDIGDFNTFRNKMQTPDNRKKFYDAVSSNGFDLGEYNSYEERLSGSKKKELSGSASASDGTEDYSGGSQSDWRKSNPYSTGDFEIPTSQPASSTATNLSRKNEIAEQHRTALTPQEFAKENEDIRKQALATTAKRSKRTEAEVQKDIDEGKLVLSTDSEKNKIYARQPGAWESFVKSLTLWKRSLQDAAGVAALKATGTDEDLANFNEMINRRKKVESEKEFGLSDAVGGLPVGSYISDSFKQTNSLPTAEPGIAGQFNGFVGGVGPDVALAAATGGMSIPARATIIGTKMLASEYGNKEPELYEKAKQIAIQRGATEEDAKKWAAQEASIDAVFASIPQATLNTAFFMGGLHSPASKNFLTVLGNTVKDVSKVSALGGGSSALTSGIEGAEGYDTKGWVDKMVAQFGDFAKLELLFKVLPIISTLPKATQSAVKEFAVDPVIKPLVEQYIKTLSEQTQRDITQQLADYEAATKDVRGIVPEEKMASIGGRIEKRKNRINGINIIKRDITELEAKKTNLPEALHKEVDAAIAEKKGQIGELEKEIDSVDKEIESINKSKGTGLEKEVDEATGEPIIPKEEPKGEPEQISQPIELSVEPSTVSETPPALRDVESTANKLKETEQKNPSLWQKIKDAFYGAVEKIGEGFKNTQDYLKQAVGTHYEELAKALHPYLSKIETEIHDKVKDQWGIGTWGGLFENGKIKIGKKEGLSTFFHEVLHSVTSNKIKRLEAFDIYNRTLREAGKPEKTLKEMGLELTDAEVDAIRNLQRIFEGSKQKIQEFLSQNSKNKSTDRTKGYYGFNNVHEFISEAFTNKEFQNLLKNIKGEGKSPTLFKQFLDAIAQLIGIKDPTILDDIFHHTEKLLDKKENEHNEISEAYHKAKADGSNPGLVKAVEDLLGKAPTQYTEAATPAKKESAGVSGSALKDVEAKKADIERRRQEELKQPIKDKLQEIEKAVKTLNITIDKDGKLEQTSGEIITNIKSELDKIGLPYKEVVSNEKGSSYKVITNDGTEIEVVKLLKSGGALIKPVLSTAKFINHLIKTEPQTLRDLISNQINAKYDAELEKIQPKETKPDIEAKKADIERRRQEELKEQTRLGYYYESDFKHDWQKKNRDEYLKDPIQFLENSISIAKENLKRDPLDRISQNVINDSQSELDKIREINAKYDAELAELEKQQPPQGKGEGDWSAEQQRIENDKTLSAEQKEKAKIESTAKALEGLSKNDFVEIRNRNKEVVEGDRVTYTNPLNGRTEVFKVEKIDIGEGGYKRIIAKNEKGEVKYLQPKEVERVIEYTETPKSISESYHKAKADGSNPELVKAVEELLSKEQTTQEVKAEQPTVSETKAEIKNETPQEPIKADELIPTEAEGNSKGEPTPAGSTAETGEGGEQPPKKEVSVTITPNEEVISITHEATNAVAKELGLPEYEANPETVAEWDAEVNRRLVENPNAIQEMMDKYRLGGKIDKYDQRMMLKYHAALKARINENPTPELIKQYNEAKQLSDIEGGREVAKSLVARKGNIPVEDDLANYLVNEANAAGVQTLPQETINDLKAKYEADQKTIRDLNARLEILEKEAAEREFSKQASKSKKSNENFTEKRKSLKDKLKQQFEEYKAAGQKMGIASDGGAESFKLSVDMAKTIGEYVKTYLDEGITKLNDVVSKLHEEIKDLIPGITERDIRDVIAGKYAEKKPTRNQIAEQVRDLKMQQITIDKIEKLQKGEQLEKNPIRKQKISEELEKLRNELKELGGERPSDEQKLQSYKTGLKNKIAKLKKDLETGDYLKEPEPKKPLKLDAEAEKLLDEHIRFVKETNLRRAKAEFENRSKGEKIYDGVMQVLGIRRIVQTAIDLSIPFRQGVTLAFNPRRWQTFGKSFEAMMKSVFSPKRFDRIMYSIHQSPDYKDMLKDKVHFNEMDAVDSNSRNEDFQKSFIYKIPFLREPLLASNRAADGFLNVARYDMYMKGKAMLERQGITRENSPESYEALGKWVMNMTGRGNMLQFLEDSHAGRLVASNTFFGARLMASRFNLLNPVYYAKMPKAVRIEAMKDMASFTGMVMATALAASAAGAKVSLDPDDSEFLKIKTGNTKYDISGGLVQYVRTFLRLEKMIAMRLSPSVSKEEKDKYSKFAVKSVGDFFRYKLAPNTSYGLSALIGKDPLGREFNPTEFLKIYPMYVDDMIAGYKENGLSSLATIGIPSILGVGVQTYESKKPENKTPFKKNKEEMKKKKKEIRRSMGLKD